tara:strand:+ start:22 stop:552 length:531 start_codon:yes stop_codon:yes gene_type:complete
MYITSQTKMSSKVSHAIQKRENPKDVFYTPLEVVKIHIGLINHTADDVWFDPFYGQGIYFNNFPTEKKDWTEIALEKDFFKYEGTPTIICSNPPYSMIDKVLEKSVSLKPRIISYLVLHGAMTTKRMEFMRNNNYGLTSIHTTKVFKWYGMSEIVTFTLGASWDNCKISFDRVVHH